MPIEQAVGFTMMLTLLCICVAVSGSYVYHTLVEIRDELRRINK